MAIGVLVLSCIALCIVTTGQNCTSTIAAIEGPYYKVGAPDRNGTICEYQNYDNASQLFVHGRVFGADCKSSIEAVLDIWSANPFGEYSPKKGNDYACRGKVFTDSNGYYEYLTVVPGRYDQGGCLRPAHIHYKISRANEESPNILTTQQYFEDDPYFKTDPCDVDQCHAGDPSLTVPMQPSLGPSDQSFMIRFDIVLPD